MNLQVCYSDAYARNVQAKVVSVEPAERPLVVLDGALPPEEIAGRVRDSIRTL